jgi:quercetin dioxygenase-like cupin family protein
MYQVIRAGEQQRSTGGTLTFEGEPYGSGVSFFLVDNEPGEGPDLHKHPYSETWIVRSGKARITADGEDIEAGPGDIAVVAQRLPTSSPTSSRTWARIGSTSSASTRRLG